MWMAYWRGAVVLAVFVAGDVFAQAAKPVRPREAVPASKPAGTPAVTPATTPAASSSADAFAASRPAGERSLYLGVDVVDVADVKKKLTDPEAAIPPSYSAHLPATEVMIRAHITEFGKRLPAKGASIQGFSHSSPAQAAQLQVGDVIIRVNATNISDAAAFLAAVEKLDPEKGAVFTVQRMEVKKPTAAKPAVKPAVKKSAVPPFNKQLVTKTFNVKPIAITEAEKKAIELRTVFGIEQDNRVGRTFISPRGGGKIFQPWPIHYCYFRPYLSIDSKGKASLRVASGIETGEWLFMRAFYVRIDGDEHEIKFDDKNVDREVLRAAGVVTTGGEVVVPAGRFAGISESVDLPLDRKLLTAIANSEEAYVTMLGGKASSDVEKKNVPGTTSSVAWTVSAEQKKQYRLLLECLDLVERVGVKEALAVPEPKPNGSK